MSDRTVSTSQMKRIRVRSGALCKTLYNTLNIFIFPVVFRNVNLAGSFADHQKLKYMNGLPAEIEE